MKRALKVCIAINLGWARTFWVMYLEVQIDLIVVHVLIGLLVGFQALIHSIERHLLLVQNVDYVISVPLIQHCENYELKVFAELLQPFDSAMSHA
jgi:hypothetical protein